MGNNIGKEIIPTTPEGFYALRVKDIPGRTGDNRNRNICLYCDAKPLCQENKDRWCNLHKCTTYDTVLLDGTIVRGRNIQVVYKAKKGIG